MKVLVAQDKKQGHVSSTDYHWCDSGDLLMFGQFQLGNGNPSEVAMCGIKSRAFTTHIEVRDLNIDKEFYTEMIIDSIEESMNCKVQKNGEYEVSLGSEWNFKFNAHDVVNELLEKANSFEDDQKLRCEGKKLFKI